jgi:outer membrane lipoprotein SlyB
MTHTLRLVSLLCLGAALAACATSNSGDTYSRDQTRTVQTVRMGTVEGVRPVKIEGTRSGVGTAAGAVVGGVAGSSLGGGRGQIITGVLGAVAGGLAGSAAEQGLTRANGVELTIKLDKGETIAIVQEAAAEEFNLGDRVRLLDANGVTRVSH